MAPSSPPAIASILNKESASDIVTQTADAMRKLDENPEIAHEVQKYGKVPTYYGPRKGMVKPPAIPGLSYFISQATTVKEVENLLASGKEKYTGASAGTVRKWEKLAAEKIASLTK